MENKLFAAVMTGKGTGAISTVQVFGENSESVIEKIFKPTSQRLPRFETGKILLGSIHDGEKTIDQVTIGCEGPLTFAIHCHGNPLIVKMIIQLLQKQGVQILDSDRLMMKILTLQKQNDAIALEAQIALVQAKTLEGTRIILNQPEYGLGKTARGWLSDIEKNSLDSMHKQVEEILQNSSIAKLIIFGCKTILTGPPNTGKSTLLNCLAGKQKSIVSDISGTTRDWVSAQCRIESMSLELVDTAGLDENFADSAASIENAAQQKSLELIQQADLILLVLDNSRDEEIDERVFKTIANKKIITALNKSDQPAKFNPDKLPGFLPNIVRISAKEETGIDNLISSIRQTCGVINFDLRSSICFTERQENLLKELLHTRSKQQVRSIIEKLLSI